MAVTERGSSKWINLLDPHLTARDVKACTDIAIEAQQAGPHEVVYLLARRNRWDDAIWLVKGLMSRFANPESQRTTKPHAVSPWSGSATSLSAALQQPIRLESPYKARDRDRTHDDPTIDPGQPLLSKFGRSVLARLWDTIGRLIIEDAEISADKINPAVLKIIAVFHEAGFMPTSLYSDHGASPDQTDSVPSLLSAHIFNALSEAALQTPSASPSLLLNRNVYEALGSPAGLPSFHFRPSGLRHEVWLELILWACIRGGWVHDGSRLLRMLADKERDRLRQETKSPKSQQRALDLSTLDQRLLTLYADANLGMIVSESAPNLRLSRQVAVSTCWKLRYLSRTIVRQQSTYIWPAKILRLFEQTEFRIDSDPYISERLLDLALRDWHESRYDKHTTDLMFRTAHAILQAHVTRGNLPGALRAFGKIVRRTDETKWLAVRQFLRTLNDDEGAEDTQQGQDGGQTSPGIPTVATANARDDKSAQASEKQGAFDQGAFYPVMPTALVAQFLNLITDVRAFSFGQWLLNPDGPDQAVIPERLYNDYHLAPALIRFAANAQDTKLLNAVLNAVRIEESTKDIPLHWRVSILECQLELRDWSGAKAAFEQYVTARPKPELLDGYAMSLLARSAIRDRQDGPGPAWEMMKRLAAVSDHPRAIKTVLAIMGSSCIDWEKPAIELMGTLSLPESWSASMSQAAFTVLVDGIVDAYGHEHGCRIVDLLWPENVGFDRDSPFSLQAAQFATSGAWLTCDTTSGRLQLRPRGTFLPNASVMRVIKAAADRQSHMDDSTMSKANVHQWGQTCLLRLGLSRQDSEDVLTAEYPALSLDVSPDGGDKVVTYKRLTPKSVQKGWPPIRRVSGRQGSRPPIKYNTSWKASSK